MQPDSRPGNYLHSCLNDFPSVCRLKYGIEFVLASVEEKVRHLRQIRNNLIHNEKDPVLVKASY
jgi:hypothetical protein